MTARPLMLAAGLATLLAGPAAAQTRPSEEDLFGVPVGDPKPPPESQPSPGPGSKPGDGATPEARRDAEILSGSGAVDAGRQVSRERDDMLKVGGVAYLRGATTWSEGPAATNQVRNVVAPGWSLVTPQLLDVYLDARPNDRVRAFTLGRLIYTPSGGVSAYDFTGVRVNSSGPTTRSTLDQLWINFDLERTAFITVGKQHVKWGTGRFWNPTDYLHPVRRDPLTQFDDRSGVTMVKAHLPWEQRGWNFYGILLLEDISGGTMADGTTRSVSTLGQVGGGGRAELVLGRAELGLDVMAQKGHDPRAGIDGSFALGELDIHFEVGLRRGRDIARWEEAPGTSATDPWVLRYQPKAIGFAPAGVVGAEWSWKYSDQDTLSIGGEYAYDASGYTSSSIYPFLLAAPQVPTAAGSDARLAFTPFYLARQYLGLYLYAPAPGSWNNTNLTLSALASLSDGSAVLRLDHSVLINTYLRIETYVAGHVGREGGEFRFGFTVPGAVVGSPFDLRLPTQVLDLGVALRVTM